MYAIHAFTAQKSFDYICFHAALLFDRWGDTFELAQLLFACALISFLKIGGQLYTVSPSLLNVDLSHSSPSDCRPCVFIVKGPFFNCLCPLTEYHKFKYK